MLGWCSLAALRISARKRSEHAARSIEWPPTTLSTSLPSHQPVLGQVDHAHPPRPSSRDLVIGWIGESRRQRAGRRRFGDLAPAVQPRPAGHRGHAGARESGLPGPRGAAQGAIRGQLGDSAPTGRTRTPDVC